MSLICILNRSLFYLSDQLNLDFLWSLVGSCKSQTGKTSSGELKDSVQFQKGIGQDEGINKHLALNSFSDTPFLVPAKSMVTRHAQRNSDLSWFPLPFGPASH
jgi:hypothetical protein